MVLTLVAVAMVVNTNDFILGSSRGFALNDNLSVDCFTTGGVKIIEDGLSPIGQSGEWCISVDGGPEVVTGFIVKVHPDNCLKKKYKVAVPSHGRPRLSIDKADFVFGDLNEDNHIDKKDLALVQAAVGIARTNVKWHVEPISNDDIQSAEHYDFNHDNKVDTADVALVQKNLGRVGE